MPTAIATNGSPFILRIVPDIFALFSCADTLAKNVIMNRNTSTSRMLLFFFDKNMITAMCWQSQGIGIFYDGFWF